MNNNDSGDGGTLIDGCTSKFCNVMTEPPQKPHLLHISWNYKRNNKNIPLIHVCTHWNWMETVYDRRFGAV